jgi:hypothetical protein
MEKEFKIGDEITLDRYNHIEDVQTVKIVGFGEMPISKKLTYNLEFLYPKKINFTSKLFKSKT